MNYDKKRWLFLVLCIVMNACAGIIYAWSVFQKPFIAQINASAADVSLSFTLMLAIGSFVPIVVGKALDYVQPRYILALGGILFGGGLMGLSQVDSLARLYIFSTITGLGVSMVYPGGTVSNMVRFFPDRRGLTSGLLTAGASLGAIIWAPVAVTLIESYGLLLTFKWIGIVVLLLICACGFVVQTAPKDYRPQGMVVASNIQQNGSGLDRNWVGMLKSPLFYGVAGVFLAGAISGMMIIGHVSPIVQDVLQLSPQAAAGVVVLLALANTSGRLWWGWVSDKIGRFTVVYILLGLGTAAMLGLSMTVSYYWVVGLIMTIGICYGGFLSLMAPCTAELFGAKHLGINFGIMFLTVGLAAVVGPRLAAVVKISSNGYSQAFIIAAALNAVGVVLLAASLHYRKRLQ
jgi:OFA family oxalate/formate antiporter-like MFS transporter